METMTDGQQGRMYGYPLCCIGHYQSGQLDPKSTKSERELGFGGTGYRPCPNCQSRPMREVYRDIVRNRLMDEPFPVEPIDLDPDQPREEKVKRYSQLLNFQKRIRKTFDWREHEPELAQCLTTIHAQINAPRLDQALRDKIAQTCDVVYHGCVYVVHGNGGFGEAQTLFRKHYRESLLNQTILGKDPDDHLTDIFLTGNYPKGYPSVVYFAMGEGRITPDGHDKPMLHAEVRCWLAQTWLDMPRAANVDPEGPARVARLIGDVAERVSAPPKLKPRVSNLPPNMEKHGANYLVRTQAGYRKAMRDYLNARGWEITNGGWYDAREHYGAYPAIINFTMRGDEFNHRWRDMSALRQEAVAVDILMSLLGSKP